MASLYDLIVVGSGAAGLSAALYAGRYNMKTLVIGKDFGGETATAWIIENYPGFESIDGYDLMKNMEKQAKKLGTEIVHSEVQKLKNANGCFSAETKDGKQFQTSALILAMGAQRRYLNLAREKEFTGKGVHYCVTCDGPLYQGKTVAMVGGGDSSVKGVNFLGEYAEKIYFIVMENKISAEPVNLERMKKLGSKVEVLLETQVQELQGKEYLESLILSKAYNGKTELSVQGVFIEIGFAPNTELPSQLGIELDAKGYIKTNNMMETNVPGVFAAGDATNHFQGFKQVITAAALGSVAATSAYEYRKIHGDICDLHARVAP